MQTEEAVEAVRSAVRATVARTIGERLTSYLTFTAVMNRDEPEMMFVVVEGPEDILKYLNAVQREMKARRN